MAKEPEHWRGRIGMGKLVHHLVEYADGPKWATSLCEAWAGKVRVTAEPANCYKCVRMMRTWDKMRRKAIEN